MVKAEHSIVHLYESDSFLFAFKERILSFGFVDDEEGEKGKECVASW